MNFLLINVLLIFLSICFYYLYFDLELLTKPINKKYISNNDNN